MEAAFVEVGLGQNAFLYAGDIIGAEDPESENSDNRNRRQRSAPSHIRDLVKRGQEVLVQVTKGPRGSKGSRVSTKMSIPGRYLVFMPEDGNTIGVSRKIDDPKERDRLKKIVESIRKNGYSLIIRTEAEDKTERELRQDLEFLERTWAEIKAKAQATPSGNLVYADLTLLLRILRDTFGQDVDRMILDSAVDYKRAQELLDFFGPGLKDRVHLYNGAKPIFEEFGIEQETEHMMSKRVPLKSGGYLIIEQTEALVSIDVNSGRSAGNRDTNMSETILQTNLEAVDEIARQLRLRDMGGIIILDLIDMVSQNDRKRVETAFESALKRDKNRCKVSHISSLGLIEMTRKRTGETLNEQMNDPCPYCSGHGRLPSPDSVAISIERDLRRMARAQNAEAFVVTCHPLTAACFLGEDGDEIEPLEHFLQKGFYVRASVNLHQEKYEIQPGRMDELDRRFNTYRKGQVVDVQIIKSPLSAPPAALGVTTTGYLVELSQAMRFVGQNIRVRLVKVGRSIATGELLGKTGIPESVAVPRQVAAPPTPRASQTANALDDGQIPNPNGRDNRNRNRNRNRRGNQNQNAPSA